MTYIITEPCIDVKDRSCVDVCPVDCIHEVGRMLVIDPEECIEGGRGAKVTDPFDGESAEAGDGDGQRAGDGGDGRQSPVLFWRWSRPIIAASPK